MREAADGDAPSAGKHEARVCPIYRRAHRCEARMVCFAESENSLSVAIYVPFYVALSCFPSVFIQISAVYWRLQLVYAPRSMNQPAVGPQSFPRVTAEVQIIKINNIKIKADDSNVKALVLGASELSQQAIQKPHSLRYQQ